jgi:hypothetical protein
MTNFTIISRAEAKLQGLKHYYTGKPCKNGHITKKLVSSTTCCECTRLAHYTYYAKHRDTALAGIKKWSQANLDKGVDTSRRYRINNPTADSTNHKKYYNANKEKTLNYNKWWRSVNKDKQQSYNAARRAQIKLALPCWAEVDKILAIYTESVEVSKQTGIMHHVDHIIPLVHHLVCGLHVHENLQILVGTENMSKSNIYIIE